MCGCQHCPGVVIARNEYALSRRLLTIGVVTILLFSAATSPATFAQETRNADVSIFQFTSELRTHLGPVVVEGVLASRDDHYRITIYWIEPRVFGEAASPFRYSDFIFAPQGVHYWVYGMPEPVCSRLDALADAPLLPRDGSVESITRSALAIVGATICQEDSDIPLEMGRFFLGGRNQRQFTRRVLSEEPSGNVPLDRYLCDNRTLNTLPYGREYSKNITGDGIVVWRRVKALVGEPVAALTVQNTTGFDANDRTRLFDADTLGRCSLIPDAYRTYWSLAQSHSKLSNSRDGRAESIELCDRIESYRNDGGIPLRVSRALDLLWFDVAVSAGDTDRVWRAAQAIITSFSQGGPPDAYQRLMGVARMCGQIEKKWPREAEEHIRRLVRHTVMHDGRNIGGVLNRVMVAVNANGWFTYGKVLLQEVASQGVVAQSDIDAMGAGIEAAHLARTKEATDSCDVPSSVRRYLASLEDVPPSGPLRMADVRHILEEGLGRTHPDMADSANRQPVADVLRLVQLIVGSGPFRGDDARLIESTERFSRLYFTAYGTTQHIDTVLATFLALSFYDISTPDDHTVLLSQFGAISTRVQAQVRTMLRLRGLDSLVTAQDVNDIFLSYEQIFQRYLEDPLWPPFKFPWTDNEEARLISQMGLHLKRLEPALDHLSLKVKYGGQSDQLMRIAMYEVSRAAQSLLPEAAFLRRPSYPGVSCQYRGGGQGFTAMIRGPLYQEGNRPREVFQAMKYFHLGHRLEEIVERERSLIQRSEIHR